MNAAELYRKAIHIEAVSVEQRKIFNWWTKHNQDPINEVLAWDTETNGLSFGLPYPLFISEGHVIETKDIFPFGISLCIPYKDTFALIWARHTNKELYSEVTNLLKVKGQKVGHNIRYDLRVCAVNGLNVNGENNCTLTMARIHWNRRREFDLKQLTKVVAPDMYGYEDDMKVLHRNIKTAYTRAGHPKGYANYSFIPDEYMKEYAKKDVFITWLLNYCLRGDIDKLHKEVYAREKEIIQVIHKIELAGMHFDIKEAEKQSKLISKKIPVITKRLYKYAGRTFNPNSPKQLLAVVKEELKLTKKDLYSKKYKRATTDKEQLLKCCVKYPNRHRLRKFVYTLLERRAYLKINGTYLKPLTHKAKLNDGFVFFNLNPTDTVTGRMTSNDPSLHTMPKTVDKDNKEKTNPVRRCFIAPPDEDLFFIDYSQMEMWLFAILAKEETMLNALLAGADIHASVAYEIYGNDAIAKDGGEDKDVWINNKLYTLSIDKQKRFKCKAVNFGIIYGMGFKQLAVQIKSNEVEAFDLRKQYLAKYPRIMAHSKEIERALRKDGYIIDPFGKRYNIETWNSYKGINAEVQGACAQIMKIALINISRYFNSFINGIRPKLRLIIHDEIVFSIPKVLRSYYPAILYNIEYFMTHIPKLEAKGIILKVEGNITSTSWEQKQHYDEWIIREIKRLERKYNGLPTKKAASICY
jgi:DNA polymerase-1